MYTLIKWQKMGTEMYVQREEHTDGVKTTQKLIRYHKYTDRMWHTHIYKIYIFFFWKIKKNF